MKPEDIVKRYDALVSENGNWQNHWNEIAERVLPRYAETMQSPVSDRTRGDKRTEKMFDATAALALDRFAAAMESMLTPRNQKWQRLKPSDSVLGKDRSVKLWFEAATNELFFIKRVLNTVYLDLLFTGNWNNRLRQSSAC